MGISKNSDFLVSARKHRTDDCMDNVGGRTMHGAIVENHSVLEVHEDSSTELTRQSREKCIFRGAHYVR